MTGIQDDAEQLGYSHGVDRIYRNPYTPADEWNHSGVCYAAYEHGYNNGLKQADKSVETQPVVWPPFVPTVGAPAWCSSTFRDGKKFDGWAIVTGVDETKKIISALADDNGEPIQFTTDEFWGNKPPLSEVSLELTDDDGKTFIVGYGDFADLDDQTKFNKLFYITTEGEEVTIPLADVGLLLEAIKHVSRQ